MRKIVMNCFILILGLFVFSFLIYELVMYRYNKQVLANFVYSFSSSYYDCDVVGSSLYGISVKRRDDNNINISGSVWKVTNLQSKKSYHLTTDDDGYSCIVGLPSGNYEVAEESVSSSVKPYLKVFNITLDDDNKIYDVLATPYSSTITLLVSVTDQYNRGINHLELNLYSNDKLIDTLFTNERGLAGVADLSRSNRYFLEVNGKRYEFKFDDDSNSSRLDIKVGD